MDQEPKNYEIAYLIAPSTPESEVLSYTGKITAMVEEEGGMVRHAEEPKKRKLAYPIKKEGIAYFGWTTFSIIPEKVKIIASKINGEKSFLRHLLVEKEEEPRVQLYPFPARETRPRPAAPRVVPRPAAVEEKLDLEALDKRLEEILGK